MNLLRQIAVARAPLYAFAAMGVVWGSYAALVPDIKAMLAVSDAQFGSLLLATPIAAVSSMLIAPRLAPRLGSHVLPLAVLALAAAFLLPGWLAMPAFFATSMVMVGATNGFLDVTMNARVSAIESDYGLHLMNLNHAAYSFAYGLAAIATGWARSSGHTPGEVLSTAAITVMLLSLITHEKGQEINGFSNSSLGGTALGMIPVWGGAIILISFMSENAAENWSALHIERTLGGTLGQGSIGPALMALTMGVGRMFGQAALARIKEAQLMVWGTVISALGIVVLGASQTPGVAYLGLVVAGLGGSVIAPTAFAILGRVSSTKRRPLVIARATALGYLGYFFGPPVLGLISQVFGLRMSFFWIAAMILLILALYPRLIASGQKS
jgi:predicted MFS family arabinose efflux permease